MANALYDSGRNAFALGDIDWVADDTRLILVDGASYTPNTATHDFLDDIPGGARTAVSASMTGKSASAGVCDANDVTFTAVAAGPANEYLVCYKHTGVDATSPLIFIIDTATGLPVTPTGVDIVVRWDNGALKVFKL